MNGRREPHETQDAPHRCGHGDGHGDLLVVVRLRWSDWRTGHVRVRDIQRVHWSHPAGAPRPLLHAVVCCQAIVENDLPHECDGTVAHQLEVCILKSHIMRCVFEDLSRRATAWLASAETCASDS